MGKLYKMDTIVAQRSLFTHLQCSVTGIHYNIERLQTYSAAGKPLVACYNLQQGLDRDQLRDRPATMWRYWELLPVQAEENRVSLGEGMTPIINFHSDGRVLLKDEAINPTGSFKARGLAVAISRARELGVRTCVIPTAGNAGGAMSAYCARAGLEAHVYMPRETPEVFQKECRLLGAKVILVDGTIHDCAVAIRKQEDRDWFDVSTLKEPYRLEGKKTMGFEIAEQLQWQLPEVIIYPTGGGTGLIGIWKAFDEMEQLGWIDHHRPRMVAVQTEACSPIVAAWKAGKTTTDVFPNPASTIANGLRVPSAFGDQMILEVIRKSGGCALTVSENDIYRGIEEVAAREGILLSPEGSAVWKANQKLRKAGWIGDSERVLLINTGSLYKYMEHI